MNEWSIVIRIAIGSQWSLDDTEWSIVTPNDLMTIDPMTQYFNGFYIAKSPIVPRTLHLRFPVLF